MKMKKYRYVLLVFVLLGFFSVLLVSFKNKHKNVKRYTTAWSSLKNYETPTWFKDAKLGIFIHWGAYSVPAYGSEWYPRNMYQDSLVWGGDGKILKNAPSEIYQYHIDHFGTQDKFGYKDFIPEFRAERFDAKAWVKLFKKAGAKYIVPVAEHHDGFAMYNSHITRWNAVNMGPHQDILGALVKEGKKQGMKVGASSHFAFNWDFYNKKKGFDTYDPAYADLYGRRHTPYAPADEEFLNLWWSRTKDIIDNYQPDILWFDFALDREEYRPYHPKLAAYYYNKGLEWNKEVVLQNKNFKNFESYPPGTNVLDLERGKMSDIQKDPWQTDTSIGKNSWGYVTNWKSKSPNTIIDDLIDIVSKNGNLLLNVGPKSDGTIPEDQKQVLLELGSWLEQNGEAIYGSSPWLIFGEGPTKVAKGHHTEKKNKQFTSADYRFTTKNDALYVFAMDINEDGKYLIHSLGINSNQLAGKKIKRVGALADSGKISWEQTADGLQISCTNQQDAKYACVFKISM